MPGEGVADGGVLVGRAVWVGLGVCVGRGLWVAVTRQFAFGFRRHVHDEKHSPNTLMMLSLSQQYCGLFARHGAVGSPGVLVGRGVRVGLGDTLGVACGTSVSMRHLSFRSAGIWLPQVASVFM